VYDAISEKINWTIDKNYGAVTSIDISDVPQGVYLVFVTDLYHSATSYNVGVLTKYGTNTRAYTTISYMALNIAVSGDTLYTSNSNYIFKVRMLKIGY
jgi:hypothetical protein